MSTSAVFPYPCEFIHVEGPDALRFLQGMWTCDLKRAAQVGGLGGLAFGFLLNNKGKIISEAQILARNDRDFWIAVRQGLAQLTLETLDRYLVADQVTMQQVQPAPWQVFQTLLDHSAATSTDYLVSSGVPEAQDKVYKVSSYSEGVLLMARGQMGERHFELWVARNGKLPMGTSVLETQEWIDLRIQWGCPEFQQDYNGENLPLEFPLGFAISYFKGCYLGQEVIARAMYRGHMVKGFARFEGIENLHEGWVYSAPSIEEISVLPDLKPVGKLSTVSGKKAMGLVRLQSLESNAVFFQKTDSEKVILISQVESLMVSI